jgi:hypothetical protein
VYGVLAVLVQASSVTALIAIVASIAGAWAFPHHTTSWIGRNDTETAIWACCPALAGLSALVVLPGLPLSVLLSAFRHGHREEQLPETEWCIMVNLTTAVLVMFY